MEKHISDRIWATRYFMVIGIIVLHLPPYQPLGELGPFGFAYVKAFFSHAVFRATVPVLTVISGYLLFQFGLHLKPKKLVSKKIRSLFLPLVVWNVPLAIAVYITQKYELLDHDFSAHLYPFHIIDWINATTGLLGEPVNYPLNFLRDLFVICLLAPVLWLFLKNLPYLGLLGVLLVFYLNLDGPLILRNSMLVSFYIGGMAARQKWDLTRLDRYAGLLLILFLAICVSIIVLKIQNVSFFRVVAPFMVWPAMSLVMNTAFGSWLVKYSSNSFFTFLSHGPIILFAWLAYQKLLPQAPYLFYWLLAPGLTVVLAILANQFSRQLVPRTHTFALGGR